MRKLHVLFARLRWANYLARVGWNDFNYTDTSVVPVVMPLGVVSALVKSEWMAIGMVADKMTLVDPGEKYRGWMMVFTEAPPASYMSDPWFKDNYVKALDLLVECEDSIWDLPHGVISAAHKFRRAIEKGVESASG